MNVYFTRHGETKDNKQKILIGQKEIPLTENGKSQAIKLKKHIENSRIYFDTCYSSPLKRAIETAQIICGHDKIQIVPEISEIDVGIASEKVCDDFLLEYPQFYHIGYYPDLNYPGGESLNEFFKRCSTWINNTVLNISNQDKSYFIIGHAGCINTMMHSIFSIPLIHYQAFHFEHCLLTHIKILFEKNYIKPEIIAFNSQYA